ncbi:hypothetical protein PCASD_07988 [Puccinia coronata f. sp. avenae]|uniref:Uncharacterized protein n=1 Tax=Puccinia coronata f. sp. avenae TaxID=200324 RepID=A0A2N5UNU8_9BASI|nr:hypothetical protein PCASD_07988 [Puccinia coronata f. sp. avenae]
MAERRRRQVSASPASNWPPSRQSTRTITPARSTPNFIRPNEDGRKSVTQTPKSATKRRSKASKRKQRDVESDVDGGSEHPHTVIDVQQDSENGNSKVKNVRKRQKKRDDILDLDDVGAYFH